MLSTSQKSRLPQAPLDFCSRAQSSICGNFCNSSHIALNVADSEVLPIINAPSFTPIGYERRELSRNQVDNIEDSVGIDLEDDTTRVSDMVSLSVAPPPTFVQGDARKYDDRKTPSEKYEGLPLKKNDYVKVVNGEGMIGECGVVVDTKMGDFLCVEMEGHGREANFFLPKDLVKIENPNVIGLAVPLYSKVPENLGSGSVELDKTALDQFSSVIFKDARWENGLAYLRGRDDWSRLKAATILRQGAKTFGIQCLSEQSVECLVNQVMSEAGIPSRSLSVWVAMYESPQKTYTRVIKHSKTKTRVLEELAYTSTSKRVLTNRISYRRGEDEGEEQRWYKIRMSPEQKIKTAPSILIFLVSNAYAVKVVFQMYSEQGILDCFGWPVYLARMGGMGVACWTAIMYVTMSRTVLTWFARRVPQRNLWLAFFESHKDLHIMAGKAMVITSAEHVAAHLIGTIPGLLKEDLSTVNKILGCANMESTPGFIPIDLSVINWPICPLEKKPKDVTEALFLTMPGLTGVLLVLLLAAVAYTGSQAGLKEHFDRFMYLHNVLVFAWPVLLFFHGSQGWIGVGLPLVVFTSSLPISWYLLDRLLRNCRYCLYAGRTVRIVSCTVRPGKDGTADGGIVHVQINKPPHLWNHQPGTYAFLNMPEYAPLQWHPFTICSGSDDDTVDFLIAGVGDWTKELITCALEAGDSQGQLPKVGLDGPYVSPTLSALFKPVFVGIGAGVGITPFFSLMSNIISVLGDDKKSKHYPLKEAHFYWTARGVDEFLFGRDLFTKIFHSPHLSNRVFLHLHTTFTPAAKDPAAFLFREAVKRQSAIDREFFKKEFTKIQEQDAELIGGPCMPSTWLSGSKADVLWLSRLVDPYRKKSKHSEWSPVKYDNRTTLFLSELAEAMGQEEEKDWEVKVSKLSKSCEEKGSKVTSGTAISSICHSLLEDSFLRDTKEWEYMIPVVFGRPDFGAEIRTIGKAWPDDDVDVYICGNMAIVTNLQEIARSCNTLAKKEARSHSTRAQVITVHYERFN